MPKSNSDLYHCKFADPVSPKNRKYLLKVFRQVLFFYLNFWLSLKKSEKNMDSFNDLRPSGSGPFGTGSGSLYP